MNRLETVIGKSVFRHPVFCSSGCYGFGTEAAPFADLAKIGAVSLKTVTLEERMGNPVPRIYEVEKGVLSSVGLQNPGIRTFLDSVIPQVKEVLSPDQIIISIGGNDAEEYIELAEILFEHCGPDDFSAVEVNASCPNVKHGGGAVSKDPDKFHCLLEKIVAKSPVSVIAKMPVDFDRFLESAKAAEAAGVNALYTSNTPVGMAIDIKTAKPALGKGFGGFSGPAIKPIGIKKTWDLYETVHIPIIASGGVRTLSDVLEYFMAGASAVGVGCENYIDPEITIKLAAQLDEYLKKNDIEKVSDLTGIAHR